MEVFEAVTEKIFCLLSTCKEVIGAEKVLLEDGTDRLLEDGTELILG